jgi:hypothetical protein
MFNYTKGFSVELWFYLIMQKYRLLDYTPIALATVIRVARQYMPYKAQRGEDFLENPESVEEWLDRIFKMDCILSVETMDGLWQRVAVDVSANVSKVQSKFDEIMQPKFWAARKELGIDRHWVILVSEKNLPSDAELIDAIYAAVDESKKCVMIDLTKP